MTQCCTVLVVDDSADMRDLLRSLLEHEGCTVFTANDGKEALDMLTSMPRPSVILLDLMMPVMSGWAVLMALRADPVISTIPVVVVSASAGQVDAADHVLLKPLFPESLLKIVASYCTMPRADDQGRGRHPIS